VIDSSRQAPRRPAVAVLTWRGEDTTRRCLASLRVLGEWPEDVLVVDNDSGTGEGSRLADEFGIAALTLSRNDGVAGGYNAAIGWACRRGYEQILLLNNDVIVSDARLVDRLAQAAGPRVAAVGPVVREADGTVWSAGGRIDWLTGHARRLHKPLDATPYIVDWVDGSCLLVRIDAVREVGGLSEAFFLYWEEVDWCVRAKRHGLRCVVDPATSVTHLRGASATGRQTRAFALRNSLLFMRRNGGWLSNATSLGAYAIIRVPTFLLRRIREGAPPREALGDAARAVGWNVRDAAGRRAWRRPADGPEVCLEDR
jgi:GT2 family glycosyltransferase